MHTLDRKRTAAAAQTEDQAIHRALSILATRLRRSDAFTEVQAVKDYLCLQSAHLTHEVFAVMFLDARNRLIAYEPMFRGTLTQTVVFPREVARLALQHNAASAVLHHNHPSGDCTPTDEDLALTDCLRSVLHLIDVQVLDHVITSADQACSMAECRML